MYRFINFFRKNCSKQPKICSAEEMLKPDSYKILYKNKTCYGQIESSSIKFTFLLMFLKQFHFEGWVNANSQ